MLKVKRYFGSERYEKGNIKEGETFSVESGLGGSFTVAFKGWSGHKLNEVGYWQVVNKGWEDITFQFTPDDASRHIFIYV